MTDLEQPLTPRQFVDRISQAYGWAPTVYAIYKWIARGLPAQKVGGRYRIRWADFLAWGESQ